MTVITKLFFFVIISVLVFISFDQNSLHALIFISYLLLQHNIKSADYSSIHRNEIKQKTTNKKQPTEFHHLPNALQCAPRYKQLPLDLQFSQYFYKIKFLNCQIIVIASSFVANFQSLYPSLHTLRTSNTVIIIVLIFSFLVHKMLTITNGDYFGLSYFHFH